MLPMPSAELPSCVFCGQPIDPGQEAAGRAPMAAHASCADAALADDAHWDAISQADDRNSPDGDAGQPATRSAGCLAAALAAVVVLALVIQLLPG